MAVDVAIPDMGESISEVVLLEWLKSEGEYVQRDEPICVLETDKANVDLPAPVAGVLHPAAEVDATLEVGASIGTIDDTASAADAAPAASEPVQEPVPEVEEEEEQQPAPVAVAAAANLDELSPAVRRLVEERSVDPANIVGTGRGGRIIKQDVLAYLKERDQESSVAAEPAASASTPTPGSVSATAGREDTGASSGGADRRRWRWDQAGPDDEDPAAHRRASRLRAAQRRHVDHFQRS